MNKGLKDLLAKLSKPAKCFKVGGKNEYFKIGGYPLVPSNFVWPLNEEGREFPFFMQIDFSQLNKNNELEYFPNKGMLYIFMDDDVVNSNFPLKQGKHFEILYYDVLKENLTIKKSESKTYNEMFLKEKTIHSYPNSEENDELMEEIENLSEKEQDKYFENYHFFDYGVGCVGGWPQIYQSSYLKQDEVQLLQINSIEDSLMFGDSGMLQFYMKIDDLKKSNFKNIQANLETT